MPYLIGTDEAGYGPNLGPLVVSVTVWQVPDPPETVDLYQRLADVIASRPAVRETRLVMADSKELYKPRGSLRHLERGLLTALRLVHQQTPGDWQQLWEFLQADERGHRHQIPWYAGYQLPLPLVCDAQQLATEAEQLQQTLAAQNIALRAVRSRVVFPQQFNEQVALQGSKGIVLSRVTLQLMADALAALEPEPVLAICDKHGGRNQYQALLQQAYPDVLVEVHGESREESVYRWGPPAARIEARFRTKAEAYLPAALASMACKYLRELSMRAFNDYWTSHVADLRPTAGYPVDARRFKEAIAIRQRELGIADTILWRQR